MKNSDTSTLDTVEEFLRACIGGLKREGRELSFPCRYGKTAVYVEPRTDETADGNKVRDRVVIRTILPKQLQNPKKSLISSVNSLAAVSAVVRDPSGALKLISRLTFYEGVSWDPRLYMGMITFAAGMQVEIHYGSSLHCLGKDFTIDLPGKTSPCLWGADTFTSTANLLSQEGIFCNASPTGLTAEFPWEPGAVSAVAGHNTCLLTIHSDMVHPVLGNGLFFRLILPLRFRGELPFEFINAMNVADAYAVDAPPYFGAWCTDPRSEFLNFVGFWPNMLYRPGSLIGIARWMKARSPFAQAILNDADGKRKLKKDKVRPQSWG